MQTGLGMFVTLAGGVEVAGLGVDAEGDDGAGVLVGGEEPGSRGVDGEDGEAVVVA